MANTRKKKDAPEVGITVVPETIEATTEAFDAQNAQALTIMIDNAVKQYSVTDNAIAEMKQRLSGLTVESVEDSEGYKLVKEGWQEVKNLRIAVEHKRKALNRNAIDYKNAVDGEAKRITALLEEIEEPLKERKDWFDNEKARIKAEAEARKQQQFVERTTFLLQRRFQFNGSMYVLGSLHITTNQIREFEDGQWSEVAARADQMFQEAILAEKEAEAAKQAQQAAQQAEMAAMIQERYETRVSWLQSKGWALENGQWMQSGIRLAGDASVRDYTKESWQEAVKAALAQLQAITVSVVGGGAPVQAPTQAAPQAQPMQAAPVQAAPVLSPHERPDTPFDMPATTVPSTDDVMIVDSAPKPNPAVVSSAQVYAEGFRACQAIIITKFHDGQQRTRAQWIELITNLKPSV